MSEPAPTHLSSSADASSAAVFLVLRRMRAPLIVLICTFTVSVFGLTLIPGADADGEPWRMSVFDAFYFMSYTASTIGYGEIPEPFTTGQRMWVTFSIYLSVLAWAYAIGTVFALLQDRGFRSALAAQRFTRRVRHLREPFILVVGFGQAGELMAQALDGMDRRFVVLDMDHSRVDALDLGSFRADVPGYAGDARNPEELIRAGMDRPNCEGVVALTDDDEANLAIVMTAALLHPDIPVVARAMEPGIAERMQEFGSPLIVDPFNLFGDELMLAARSPATYRLIQWLTSNPGDELPGVPDLPRQGRWTVSGFGRFGSHLAGDLIRHRVQVTVIDPRAQELAGIDTVAGSPTDPDVLRRADLRTCVGFAAATDNDTTNLSLIVAARRANPDLYVVACQNQPVNAPLFDALHIDSVLVPTTLTAHEAMARIGSPLLWRFIQEARQQPDPWSAELLQRLTASGSTRRPELWRVRLDPTDAPALASWLREGDARLGTLLHDPEDRDRALDAVVLLLRRGPTTLVAPPDDTVLAAGDDLLLAGTSADRRALDTTLCVPAALEYVVSGRRVGNSWVWRALVNRE